MTQPDDHDQINDPTVVEFTRVSERRHLVTVTRGDDTTDTVELDLDHGVWGGVARGGRLDGTGLDGGHMHRAEQVAGPVQTLMRTGADAAMYLGISAADPAAFIGLGVSAKVVLGHVRTARPSATIGI